MKPPDQHPPKYAQKFLRWFLRNELAEEVEGDLEEKFYQTLEEDSLSRAKRNYWYQIFHYLRPFAIRNLTTFYNPTHYTMYRNYLKIGWRNLRKQKMYSAIKVGGFALGIATCMIIALFVKHEISYDKHYTHADRIFRVYSEYNKSESEKWSSFPAPVAQIIKEDFPEVEKSGRLIPYTSWYLAGNNLLQLDGQSENFYEEKFAYADQELLEILQIPMVYGSQQQALAEPNSIVISERKAEKYFPGENPIGQTIILNEEIDRPYKIGGVMENFPTTSHLQFDFLVTLTEEEFWEGEQTSWCCWNYNVYLQLRPDANPLAMEDKLASVKDTYYIDYLEQTGNQDIEDAKKYLSFLLQPVSNIYLEPEVYSSNIQQGDIQYVWLFGGVAVFILLLACVNFINLSTAKSANRAKEVGLRKVVGSIRSHIVRQFLTESLLFSFISFVLAVLLVWLTLPYFNQLADKSLAIPWASWWLLPLLLLFIVLIGVLAGIYPSFYLSAFRPIDVLKGKVSRGSKSSKLRSALVIFQFATSIVLIAGTFIIYQQMRFILTKKVGFDKDQVIVIQGANTLGEKQTTFKNRLLSLSEVENVTISRYLPVTGTNRDQNQFWREGKSQEEKAINAQRWSVDADYINTMGMELLEGRNFMPEMASDSQAIIINRTMAEKFGFEEPVGQRIMNWEIYTVIGVVEDFHFESLKGEITPLAFTFGGGGDLISVKVNSENMASVVESVTDVWDQFMPNQTIRYTFLDESYALMYEDIRRTGRLLTIFTFLAVIVACLGLFALSAFMAEQRRKEVSIRLVLGATFGHIFRLLTQNYLILILISLVIAAPIAWYFMQRWLEDYEYRIPIQWDTFALAGLMAIGIAILTVSYQSIRAALVNPADNLRSE